VKVQRRRPFQQRSFDGLFVSFDGNLWEVLPFDGLFVSFDGKSVPGSP
jgi:hypothetical protein